MPGDREGFGLRDRRPSADPMRTRNGRMHLEPSHLSIPSCRTGLDDEVAAANIFQLGIRLNRIANYPLMSRWLPSMDNSPPTSPMSPASPGMPAPLPPRAPGFAR